VSETDEAGALADVPQSWPVAGSTDLHRDDWVVALRADVVETPDGQRARRVVMEHPGAAVVLAVDDEQQVVVLRQYRHAAGRRFVELPAGLLDGDPGEQPLDVARRELREEAGLEAADWTHLASTWPSPGISAEVQHLFLARGLREVDRDFEPEHEEADMQLARVPLEELCEAVLDGRVTDAPLVQCVLLAGARGLL
jgi:8-oxo-dGDP phosphatase